MTVGYAIDISPADGVPADASDVVDQAVIVPLPDDERDVVDGTLY